MEIDAAFGTSSISLVMIANFMCVFVYLVILPRVFRAVMEVPTDKPFSEDQARFYFRDVLRGIEYRESPLFLPLLRTVVL